MGALQEVARFSQENFALLGAYLESHRSEMTAPDVGLAKFVCVTTIEALTHTAVLHHSEVLADERMAAFIGETTRLIVGYLGC